MNAESVREAENFSRMQIWPDELLVYRRLRLIRGEHVDPVRALSCLVGRHHRHAIGPRLLRTLPLRVQPNNDLVTAVAQVLRLRMTLAAVSEDGDRLAL